MIQIDFFKFTYDSSENHDNVFDDDPFCNENDDQINMFDHEIYSSANPHDNRYHPFRSKSDSKRLHHKSTSSKFQPISKLSDFFYLPDTDTVCAFPTSIANQ